MTVCPRYGAHYKRCGHYRPYGRCGQCGATGRLAALADQFGVDPSHAPMGYDEPPLRAPARSNRPVALSVKVKPRPTPPLAWPSYWHEGKEYSGGEVLPNGALIAYDCRDRKMIAYPVERGGILIEARQALAAAEYGWRVIRTVELFRWTGEPDLVEVEKP